MDIKTAAAQGFTLLAQQYKIDSIFDNNFWFGGNALHTCLDYMIAAGVNDPAQDNLLVYAYEQIYKPVKDVAWWHDDFGWWGDAFVLAINNRAKFGYGGSNYDALFRRLLTEAEHCWNQMTWDGTDAYGIPEDHAKGAAHLFGGVFNLKSLTEPMAGRNSVTNEGFWLLSLGLNKLQPSPAYQQAVNEANTWMRFWLSRSPGTCDGKGTGAPGILDAWCHVLERPTGNSTVPEWFWTGDQGLFCRALRTAAVEVPRIEGILNAMMDSLMDSSNVLHENMSFVQLLGGFTGDYATGKGIFMRSAIDLGAAPGGRLWQMMLASAQAVWCNRNIKGDPGNPAAPAANQFTFNWNRNPNYEPIWLSSKSTQLDFLIQQAAGQDALNAALVLDPTLTMPCD
jgi:hypothetical protein